MFVLLQSMVQDVLSYQRGIDRVTEHAQTLSGDPNIAAHVKNVTERYKNLLNKTQVRIL